METPVPSSAPGTDPEEVRPFPWVELLETAFRRRGFILTGLVLGLVVAGWSISTTPPLYRAQARIMLPERSLSSPEIQTQMVVLRSPGLIRSVLEPYHQADEEPEEKKFGLSQLRSLILNLVPELYARLHNTPAPTELDRQVRAVKSGLDVYRIPNSNVIRIWYTSGNPDWSAQFLNEMLDRHIERVADLDDRRTQTFFQDQAQILEQKWREAREALAGFRALHETGSLGGDETQLRALVARLRSDRESAEADATGARARVAFLTEELSREPGSVDEQVRVESDPVRRLESRLLDLRLKRSELLADYTVKNPAIRDLDRQIEDTERLLEAEKAGQTFTTVTSSNPASEALRADLVQARAQLSAAEQKILALSDRIAEYRQRLLELESAGMELERLETQATLAEEAYQNYQRKAEEARFSNAMDDSRIVNVTILERAVRPTESLAPPFSRNLLIGALAGIVFGAAVGFIRDYWDPSVKSAAQASRLAGARVLAGFPAEPSSRR
jgi:uncharacterized protein involved in exopolysaccharide biosynthesis